MTTTTAATHATPPRPAHNMHREHRRTARRTGPNPATPRCPMPRPVEAFRHRRSRPHPATHQSHPGAARRDPTMRRMPSPGAVPRLHQQLGAVAATPRCRRGSTQHVARADTAERTATRPAFDAHHEQHERQRTRCGATRLERTAPLASARFGCSHRHSAEPGRRLGERNSPTHPRRAAAPRGGVRYDVSELLDGVM